MNYKQRRGLALLLVCAVVVIAILFFGVIPWYLSNYFVNKPHYDQGGYITRYYYSCDLSNVLSAFNKAQQDGVVAEIQVDKGTVVKQQQLTCMDFNNQRSHTYNVKIAAVDSVTYRYEYDIVWRGKGAANYITLYTISDNFDIICDSASFQTKDSKWTLVGSKGLQCFDSLIVRNIDSVVTVYNQSPVH